MYGGYSLMKAYNLSFAITMSNCLLYVANTNRWRRTGSEQGRVLYVKGQKGKMMNGKKNRNVLRVISIFLWAVIITTIFRLYVVETGNSLLVYMIAILVCVLTFFGWWVYMSMRINRLIKRIDKAGFQYLTTHDVDAYLTELDECVKIPGVEKITLSSMPAKGYLTILKIMTLRGAGRTAEASALLETSQTEIINDRAQQLLKAEDEQLR